MKHQEHMDKCGGCAGDINVWGYLTFFIIYFNAATFQRAMACNHVVIIVLFIQLNRNNN